MHKKILIIAILTISMLIGSIRLVSGATAPAQLAVPGTKLDLSGTASPGALVQIYDGGALIGSVVAGVAGSWNKQFPAMESGLHNLRLSYTDTDGLSSATVSQTLNVRAQKTTTANYFLPPTVQILPESVREGGVVSVSGSSAANSTIDIVVDGGSLTLRPQTDSSGRYSIAFDTTSYFIGEHIVQATGRFLDTTSYPSGIESFQVTAVDASAELPRSLSPPTIDTPSPLNTADQSVIIRGQATPNSQIIAYLDNLDAGSTFANGQGEWFINIFLTRPSQQLRFRACIEETCSDLSSLLEVEFTGSAFCPAQFQLGNYRYHSLKPSSPVSLQLLNLAESPPYEILINWGEGTSERFNHDESGGFEATHYYQTTGQYNGSVTVSDASGCDYSRYFSASVSSQADIDWRWGLVAVPPLIGGLSIALVRMRRSLLAERRATADLS